MIGKRLAMDTDRRLAYQITSFSGTIVGALLLVASFGVDGNEVIGPSRRLPEMPMSNLRWVIAGVVLLGVIACVDSMRSRGKRK
jgi:hypothetical protein